jgi:hypothetical protein
MSPLSLLKQYNIIFAELRQIEAARPSESSLQSRLQHMQAGSIKFHDARQLVRLLETLRPQRIDHFIHVDRLAVPAGDTMME